AAEALALADSLVKMRPDDVDAALEAAAARRLFGESLMHRGRPGGGGLGLERARAATRQAVRRVGDGDEGRGKRARFRAVPGHARRMDGALDAAADALAQGEAIIRARRAKRPDDVDCALALVATLVDFALLERTRARFDAALGRDVEALGMTADALPRPE